MMKALHQRILRVLLTGGALGAVAASGGCFSHQKASVDEAAQQQQQQQSITAAAPPASDPYGLKVTPVDLTSDPARPPAINVFGEFDGVERRPGPAHGEAGFQQHTYVDEGYDADVAVDPSAKWIVFASTRHSVHPNLYLQRVDGMAVTQLTNDDADYAYPTFSPDGKQVACCSTRAGNWGIYVMDLDGKNVVQVTNTPMQCVHPSFSPDGTKLVYCCLGTRSGQWELWTVDLTTGERKMIGFGLFPSWSPNKDGNRIAFQRARQRGGRWFSLWTLDLVEGEARHVTEVAISPNAAIVAPSWSPDGQRLAFATIAQAVATTGTSDVRPLGQEDVWTVNADGSNRHRLTDGVGVNLSPAWAADGRVYFTSDRGGNECIWSARADAGHMSTAKTPQNHVAPDTLGATDGR